MRPAALESLRGMQAALAEVLLPDLRTMFAQDAAQVLQFMVESLAAEWDTAADDLHRDNATLCGILAEARAAMNPKAGSNARLASLVNDIDAVLGRTPPDSLAVSALQQRNTELTGALERLLIEIEESGEVEGGVGEVRRSVYRHLREVAVRGWSFWDIMSFRERMARARADGSA